MRLENIGLLFQPEYLRAALVGSLLSLWVLLGLFFYLKRYNRTDYFNNWMAAWFFYALWLTSSALAGEPEAGSIALTIEQGLLSLSAVFLFWGSLRYLGLLVGPRLLGGVILFLMFWIVVSTQVLSSALLVKLPVFILLGLGSPFAGLCCLRLQRQKAFLGAGMLLLGIPLWGLSLTSYPFSLVQCQRLYSAAFLGAAVLQFSIAAGMIAFVVEEIRSRQGQARAEAEAVRLNKDKDDSDIKVITGREESPHIPAERLSEGAQRAYKELRRNQQAVVQQERLLALGQTLSGVTDDINSALSPIMAYSELLLSSLPDLADAPPQRLEKIGRAADEVAQIVARMREFYRRDLKPDQAGRGSDPAAPRRQDLIQREGTSLHTKFERLLLECTGDFSIAQPGASGPIRWFSLRK